MTNIINLESIDSLNVIRQKVATRQIDFSKDELLHLEEVYIEIQKKATGKTKVLDKGCSSCIASAANIVYNYITFHEPKEFSIEENIPSEDINIVLKEVAGDELDDLSLSELRELYPNIKSTSKEGFLKKVRELK
jgi:hypothetical protein